MRLILHTAAYWLMLTVRDAIPGMQPAGLKRSEFLCHPAAVVEDCSADQGNYDSGSKLAFAAKCPDAALFRGLIGAPC